MKASVLLGLMSAGLGTELPDYKKKYAARGSYTIEGDEARRFFDVLHQMQEEDRKRRAERDLRAAAERRERRAQKRVRDRDAAERGRR